MATLALDFDGVIHDHLHPVPGRRDAAHRRHVEDWLRYYGFPELPVTNEKGDFDLLIDDHAVHFRSWFEFDLFAQAEDLY